MLCLPILLARFTDCDSTPQTEIQVEGCTGGDPAHVTKAQVQDDRTELTVISKEQLH